MSVRRRLYVFVIIATLVPILLATLRYYRDTSDAIATAIAELPLVSAGVAEDLNNTIAGTVQLLYGLARSRDLLDPDPASCSEFLSVVQSAYPQFTGIVTIDPAGRMVCDSMFSGQDLNVGDRAYFERAEEPGTEVVFEPVFGRLSGRAIVQVVYPVRNTAEELDYLLVASLDLRTLIEAEDRRFPDQDFFVLGEDGTVFIATNTETELGTEGESAAGSDTFRLITESNTYPALRSHDDEDRVWGAARVSGPDWISGLTILVGSDRNTISGSIIARLRQNLIAIAIAQLFLATVVGGLLELSLRRQFARVSEMTRNLGRGNFAWRIPEPFPRGEVGDLMRQLNDTAASLERQRTDIADLNEKLVHSQKMEAVGQLTGGVAHDFNNLLTVILGSAEMLVDDGRLDPQNRRLAETVMTAADRAAEVTSRLLAFARRQPLAPKRTDVNDVIAGFEPLLRRLMGENYDIDILLSPDLSPALIDRGQLEAAILNLCINARDAMPDKGRLTIETQNAILDDVYARQQAEVVPGYYVLVTISDNGTGMNADTLARAFDPFFTTKDVGRGSGLGLSMVYGFAKQSRGHVRLYSEVGRGTTVRLYLPRDPDQGSNETNIQPVQEVESGHEKILLVEDDDMVREHVSVQLRQLGYDVVTAPDGPTALALLDAHPDIDLLFTDVVMPSGINGPDVAEAARLRIPRLKVLYTSGYSDKAIIHNGRLDAGVNLLVKPYRQVELSRKVRDVLDAEVDG